jgi:hypothetical protein
MTYQLFTGNAPQFTIKRPHSATRFCQIPEKLTNSIDSIERRPRTESPRERHMCPIVKCPLIKNKRITITTFRTLPFLQKTADIRHQ